MIKKIMLLLVVCLLTAQGCTSILYDELEARQRDDCYNRMNPKEIEKCLNETNMARTK
jgi:uncharacterized protein YceK